MIKKILCAVMIASTITAFASCGCASQPEPTNPPESVQVNTKTDAGQYASFITNYKWINEKSGDTLKFNDNGSFSGKIAKKSYSGKFTLFTDKKKSGIVYSHVTLDDAKKAVKWTFEFKDSAHMTVTTDKKASESFVSEWTIETKEEK